MSRAEDFSSKMRTLSYENERLSSMHNACMEQLTTAEKNTNLFKSRLKYVGHCFIRTSLNKNQTVHHSSPSNPPKRHTNSHHPSSNVRAQPFKACAKHMPRSSNDAKKRVSAWSSVGQSLQNHSSRSRRSRQEWLSTLHTRGLSRT